MPNQNAVLDQSLTRFKHMLEYVFESQFEICVLIGQHLTSAFWFVLQNLGKPL